MLGGNSTNLAVYIKIKGAAELCWLKQEDGADWLLKASGVWCVAKVGGGGVGVALSQLHSDP